MKENLKRKWIPMGLLLILLVSLFFPLATGQAASPQVRLTIDNRSPKQITLLLKGPANYYFKVAGESKATYAVNRGQYAYTATGCGRTVSGTLDISVNRTLVMPVCGGSAAHLVREPYRIDLGVALKVVKIKLENKATGRSLVVMTGPSTYVFSLDKDAVNTYTVAKGDYKVTTYTCGRVGKSTFEAYKEAKLVIKCP